MTKHDPRARERIVISAAQLIRRDGVAATGLREVVEHAGAPRGSLQHYFPNGKEQLVNEAVEWAGRYAARRVARYLDGTATPTPSGLFTAMTRQWIEQLPLDGFTSGCPVAAASVDCAANAEAVRDTVAAAFTAWRAPIADGLVTMGVPRRRATALATLMVSSLEGALLIARAEQDLTALRTVTRELGPLLDAAATA